MRRLFIGIVLAAALSATGCTKDSAPTDEQGEGRVAFILSTSDEVSTSGSDQTRVQKQLPASYIPDPEDFAFTISTADGEFIASYESLNDYDQPLLQHGDYKVKFVYGNKQAEGTKANYFEGATDFKVIARKTATVSLSAALANSALSLTTSNWFKLYYTSATLTIRTQTGHSVAFSVRSGVQQPNSDALNFIVSDTDLYLSGTAKKTNGVEVKFPETYIGTVKTRTWHTINVDMSSAAQLSLSVVLDDTMTEIPEEIELNPEA